MTTFPITPQGLEKLREELRRLITKERPAIVKEIEKGRSFGDLSENAEYHAAKERQALNERRIQELEIKIAHAKVIDISTLSGPKICFGATVHLMDEDTKAYVVYQIVGEDESDIKSGKISVHSLLSRELIGKEEGTSFEFSTPRGEKSYFIKKVEYIV